MTTLRDNLIRGLLIGSLAVLAISCEGEGGGGSGAKWACDTRADNNACIEYTGSEWTGVRRSNYEATCTSHPGTVTTLCPFPTGGLGGTCRTYIGAATEQTFFYYYDSGTQVTSCTGALGGVWTDATP
mgnify:CR=1 FL=1